MPNFSSSNSQFSLDTWKNLPNGEKLHLAIEQQLEQWWHKFFGYHLVKLGPLSGEIDTSACTINHQITLTNSSDFNAANIIGDQHELPLQNASVDLILANFLLEFTSNPYKILREIDRVLVSDGYLVMTGFNPLSLALLGKLIPKYQQEVPWAGHFYSPSRVKDWLSLLGYQIIADQRLVYHPLFGDFYKGKSWQKFLSSWLPGAGSIYFLVAKKLDSPLTPIRQKRVVRKARWQPVPSAGKIADRSSNYS